MPDRTRLAVGLDVGGTKVAGALVGGDGRVLGRVAPVPTPTSGGRELTRLLARQARDLAGQADGPIAAAGVSVAGRVEPGTGVVEFAPHLPGLAGFPLGPVLSDELGVPTAVVYDGHAGALGEYRHGAGRGSRNMAFLIVGTGVGGGLVLDGRLHQGSRGIAGAAGWMIVDPWAAATPLARQIGALESAAAGPAIAAAAGRPAPDVAAAAAAGDARCRAAVEDAARALAHAVVGIVSLLDLDAVVLGGGVGSGLDVFTARARAAVSLLAQPASRDAVRIVPAALGGDAFLLGAVDPVLLTRHPPDPPPPWCAAAGRPASADGVLWNDMVVTTLLFYVQRCRNHVVHPRSGPFGRVSRSYARRAGRCGSGSGRRASPPARARRAGRRRRRRTVARRTRRSRAHLEQLGVPPPDRAGLEDLLGIGRPEAVLAGSALLREALESGVPPAAIVAGW